MRRSGCRPRTLARQSPLPAAAARPAARECRTRTGDQRPRKRLAAPGRPSSDLEDPLAVVDPLDGYALLGRRVDIVARTNLVILRREAQRVNQRSGRLRQRPRRPIWIDRDATDRLAVALDQRLLVGVEAFEVGPPFWLRLAAVVVEELREQPPGLGVLIALVAILGYSPGESGLEFVDLGARLGIRLTRLSARSARAARGRPYRGTSRRQESSRHLRPLPSRARPCRRPRVS